MILVRSIPTPNPYFCEDWISLPKILTPVFVGSNLHSTEDGSKSLTEKEKEEENKSFGKNCCFQYSIKPTNKRMQQPTRKNQYNRDNVFSIFK